MNRQEATEELARQVLGWHKETYTGFFIPGTVPYTERWLNQNGSWVASTQWNPWDNIADAMMLLNRVKADYDVAVNWYHPDNSWTVTIGTYCVGIGVELAGAITSVVCKVYRIEIEKEVGNA